MKVAYLMCVVEWHMPFIGVYQTYCANVLTHRFVFDVFLYEATNEGISHLLSFKQRVSMSTAHLAISVKIV